MLKDYREDRVCLGLPSNRTPHIELTDFIRFTGDPIPEGQSLPWVAKIAARRNGEDEILFRVYQEGESLDIVEPADWSIVARGVRSDARLDLVMLRSTGQTRRWFDELRIVTSLAATDAARAEPPAQPAFLTHSWQSDWNALRKEIAERAARPAIELIAISIL